MLAIAIAIAGCTSWREVEVAPAPLISRDTVITSERNFLGDDEGLHLYFTNGTERRARSVAFRGDTMFAFAEQDSTAYARASIDRIRQRTLNRTQTVFAGLAAIAAFFVGMWLASDHTDVAY